MSFLTRIYEGLMRLLTPFLTWVMHWRLKKGYEPQDHFYERLGYASIERPEGPLIWFHGASVGEGLCALPVIEMIKTRYPHITIIITTVTEYSGNLLKKRLPEGVIHQYAPVDAPFWVDRFMNHWKPDMSLWIESELWPYMIHRFKKSGKPLILINAKISQKSFKKWRFAKSIIQSVLGSFDKILTQNEKLQTLFQNLGAKHVYALGNLKTAASPLPYDHDALESLQKITQGRPLWVAASTHKGDEAFIIKAHHMLLKECPHLLTIIIPRHIDRAAEIGQTLKAQNIDFAMRSHQKFPQKHHSVYVADTLNELGLFYRLTDIAFIGGSFPFKKGLFTKALGGHNPLEAAVLGCATLFGPDMHNNQDAADRLLSNGAAHSVKTAREISDAVLDLLNNHHHLHAMKASALKIGLSQQEVLKNVMHHLIPYLERL